MTRYSTANLEQQKRRRLKPTADMPESFEDPDIGEGAWINPPQAEFGGALVDFQWKLQETENRT